MKRKIFSTTIAALLAPFILYMAFSFAMWGFNPSQWPSDTREIAAFFLVAAMIVGGVIGWLLIDEDAIV